MRRAPSAAIARVGTPADTAPLVGRGDELAQLHDLIERVARKRSPHLVTVIGEAGVGKTRLLQRVRGRAVAAASRGRLVRRGRCLPYGSSIVYWPLGRGDARRVRDRRRRSSRRRPGRSCRHGSASCSTSSEPENGRLRELQDGRDRSAAGNRDSDRGCAARAARTPSAPAKSSSPRCARASRAWRAKRRWCLIWEDIHWADEGMLDLIEHLVAVGSRAGAAALPRARRAARAP